MKVVLDSNILIADYSLKKPAAKILLEQSKNGMLDVYVPKVVMDEVLNKFRQRLETAREKISSEMETVVNLTEQEIETPITNEFVEYSLYRYKERLHKQLSDHRVTIMEYPETKHEFLAQKAMLKKKPFNINEKGYRDCLIWENVKSLISTSEKDIASSPELVFITNNHTDFMSGEGLHDDLIAELEEEDLQRDILAMYRSLQDFSDKVMKLYLVQADIFMARLNNNEFEDFELKQFLIDYLYKNYVGHDLGEFEFVMPGDFPDDEREVTGFHEDFEIRDLSVKKLSADEFVVDLRVDLETELEFFLDKSDYFWGEESSFNVIDYNWNDHVMLVGETEVLPFTFTIIFNLKLECQSIEINKFDEI